MIIIILIVIITTIHIIIIIIVLTIISFLVRFDLLEEVGQGTYGLVHRCLCIPLWKRNRAQQPQVFVENVEKDDNRIVLSLTQSGRGFLSWLKVPRPIKPPPKTTKKPQRWLTSPCHN